MSGSVGGRGLIPSAPPSSPPLFAALGESIEIRACSAICDHTWTRRGSAAAQIAEIGRNLSGRDFGRSIGKARRHRDDLPEMQPAEAPMIFT
jgi:hypothetical protein